MRKYMILCLVLCLAFSLGVSPAAASGEASGASGEVNADDESVILPEAVTLDELILGAGDLFDLVMDSATPMKIWRAFFKNAKTGLHRFGYCGGQWYTKKEHTLRCTAIYDMLYCMNQVYEAK